MRVRPSALRTSDPQHLVPQRNPELNPPMAVAAVLTALSEDASHLYRVSLPSGLLRTRGSVRGPVFSQEESPSSGSESGEPDISSASTPHSPLSPSSPNTHSSHCLGCLLARTQQAVPHTEPPRHQSRSPTIFYSIYLRGRKSSLRRSEGPQDSR